MSDIDFVVDRLEEIVQQSPRVPMTGKMLVDEDVLQRLVEQLRETIPVQLREANRVLQERDAIIAQGEDKAAGILRLAQEQSDQMTSESSILLRAEGERRAVLERAEADATQIREIASREAATVREEADDYALSVLRDLERTLANGIALLRQTRGQPPIAPPAPRAKPRVASPPARPARPGAADSDAAKAAEG